MQSALSHTVRKLEEQLGVQIWHREGRRLRPTQAGELWTAAREGGGAELADLIMLGAHSGARIEELCSLKLEHLTTHHSFKVVDAKTGAGIREVPIHSAIRPLVLRLKRASKDDYLLSGLTFNKYGDRSNAIGKRFGRLKAAHGFGDNAELLSA